MEFAPGRKFFKIFPVCKCIEHKLDALLCLFLRSLFFSYIRGLEIYDIRAVFSFFYQIPSAFEPVHPQVYNKIPFHSSGVYAVLFLLFVKSLYRLFACLKSLNFMLFCDKTLATPRGMKDIYQFFYARQLPF